VSEADSPVLQAYVKSKDGAYVAAVIRRPKGGGPFPAIVFLHGAPGGRGGDWNEMNVPSKNASATAIDDGLAVIEHVKGLPHVDASRISLYGVSLGGNLAMYLVSKVPTIHAAVLGAPAPIWFLGVQMPADGPRDFSQAKPDPAVSRANIAPIRTPILILVGTEDRLLPLDTGLHDALVEAGKAVQMDVYEDGYHDFVLGSQGQKRPDLAKGEILLRGALEALENAVAFVKR
jgi:dienelactone hydrolase